MAKKTAGSAKLVGSAKLLDKCAEPEVDFETFLELMQVRSCNTVNAKLDHE